VIATTQSLTEITDARDVGTSGSLFRAPAQRRQRQSLSQEIQTRFISFAKSSSCISISAAAWAFGIPISLAHTIMKKADATGPSTNNRWGGARSKKMTQEALDALSEWVHERPDITLRGVCDKLQREHSISVSQQTVSKALTHIGFTVKLIRATPLSRNCPSTIQARREYSQRFLADAPVDCRDVIWVDKTGFNLHLRRKYGRAQKGNRATISVANSRGKNISICVAMSAEGFLCDRINPGSYNAEIFFQFLKELFQHLCQQGRNSCWVIMDNARFHHCAIIHDCARRYGHSLIYLPPYSPRISCTIAPPTPCKY